MNGLIHRRKKHTKLL